jgi:hypothetical protein
MKKIFLVFVVSYSFSWGFSQIINKSMYLISGLTYSNMIGTDIDKTSFLNGIPSDTYTNGSSGQYFKFGSRIGLGFQKRFKNRLYLQLEACYERKGCKIKLDETWDGSLMLQTTGYSNVSIDYLNFPMITKVYLNKGLNYYLNGGIVVGFMLKATEKSDNVNISNKDYEFSKDKSGRYSFYDLSYRLGLGSTFTIVNQLFDFGFYGTWSINDIECLGMTPRSNGYFHNQSFQVYLDYHLKKW